MSDLLEMSVRGRHGMVGTVTYRQGDDPLETAADFGKEHGLAPAAVLRLAQRIKTQAQQVFKLRGTVPSPPSPIAEEDETVLNVRIRGKKDGVFGTIQIRKGDDPATVAAAFGTEHNLPAELISRLITKISTHVDKERQKESTISSRDAILTSFERHLQHSNVVTVTDQEEQNTPNRRPSYPFSGRPAAWSGSRDGHSDLPHHHKTSKPLMRPHYLGHSKGLGQGYAVLSSDDEDRAEDMYRKARLRSAAPAEPTGASQFVKSPVERSSSGQPRFLQSSEKSDSVVSVHTRPARMEAEWRERTERNLRQQQKEDRQALEQQQAQQILGLELTDGQEGGLEGGLAEVESHFGLQTGSGSVGEKGTAIGSLSYDDFEEDEGMSERHNEARAAAAWTFAKESVARSNGQHPLLLPVSVALTPHQPPPPSPTNGWMPHTNTGHPHQPDFNINQPDYRYESHTPSGADTNVGTGSVGMGVGTVPTSSAMFGSTLNSPSRTKKQQQLVCERLHGQAERREVRKASLKKRVEKDRKNEVQRTSVKGISTSTTRSRQQRAIGVGPSMLNGMRGGSSGHGSASSSGNGNQSFHEALYYSDMKWQQNRAKRLEAEVSQRARQQEIEEEKMNTFVPVLSTSKEMQQAAVARRGVVLTRADASFGNNHHSLSTQKGPHMVDVFTHLYRKKDLTEAKKKEKARVIRAETDAENVFVPHINEISDRMSRRLRSERGQSVDRARSRSNERGQSIERGRRSKSADRVLPSSRQPHPSSLSPQHQQPPHYHQQQQSPLRETQPHASNQSIRSPNEQHHRSPGPGLAQGPELGPRDSPNSTADRGVIPTKKERGIVKESPFSAEYTVFDSLYDSRLDHAASLWQARETHLESFHRSTSHQPNIGVNTFYPVERNRQAFFQRLYEAGSHLDSHLQATKQQIREEVIQEERGISTGGTVGGSSGNKGGAGSNKAGGGGFGNNKGVDDKGLSSPRPRCTSLAIPPPLTAEEEKKLLHRLTVVDREKHEETMRSLHQEAEEEMERVRQEGKELRTNPKSMHIANRQQRRALSEVYDMLLATVLYSKHVDSGLGQESTKTRASPATSGNTPSRGFVEAKENDVDGLEGSGGEREGLASPSQQQQSQSQLQQQLKPQPPSEIAFVLSLLETQHQNDGWNAQGQGLGQAPGPGLDLFTTSPTARMTATMNGFSPKMKGVGSTGQMTGNLVVDSIGSNDNRSGTGLLARAKRSLSQSRSNTLAQTESTATTSTTIAITTTTTPLTVATHSHSKDPSHRPTSSNQQTPTTSSPAAHQRGAFSPSSVHRSGEGVPSIGGIPLEDSSYTRTLLTIIFPNSSIVDVPTSATGPDSVHNHISHADEHQSPVSHPIPSYGSRTVHARTVHAFAFTHTNQITPIPGLSTGSNRERCGDEVAAGIAEGSGVKNSDIGDSGNDGAVSVDHLHPYDDEDGLSIGGLVDLRKAQPSLLQPRTLAQAVSMALRAAQEDRVILIAEGTLPPDSQDAYLLGRNEFVHRMERLIEQCQVPPIREALLSVEKRTCNNTNNTIAPNTMTNRTTAVVPGYSNQQQAASVLAPSLHRSAYEENQLRHAISKRFALAEQERLTRLEEHKKLSKRKSEQVLKQRVAREPLFALRASAAIPLEDYLIHTLRESQLLRESLKHAWDGEVYRECTFTPFAQRPTTTMSQIQTPFYTMASSKHLGFVDAIPSPIGWQEGDEQDQGLDNVDDAHDVDSLSLSQHQPTASLPSPPLISTTTSTASSTTKVHIKQPVVIQPQQYMQQQQQHYNREQAQHQPSKTAVKQGPTPRPLRPSTAIIYPNKSPPKVISYSSQYQSFVSKSRNNNVHQQTTTYTTPLYSDMLRSSTTSPSNFHHNRMNKQKKKVVFGNT